MKSLTPTSKSSKQSSSKKSASESLVVSVAAAFGDLAKSKSINFKVILKCTNEQFTVKKFPISMKIRDLKSFLEFVCGIPYNLQRLSYLDDGRTLLNEKSLLILVALNKNCFVITKRWADWPQRTVLLWFDRRRRHYDGHLDNLFGIGQVCHLWEFRRCSQAGREQKNWMEFTCCRLHVRKGQEQIFEWAKRYSHVYR